MKRFLSLMLAVLMLLLTAVTAQAAEPIVYPLSEQTVTLKVAIPKQAVHENEAELKIWKDLEKLTNVHLEFVEIPEENVTEVVSLMLATGDYPDVFWGKLLNNQQIATYSNQGVFVPLDDLIAKYAPDIQAMFETEDFVYALTAVNDGLYSLPYVDHNPGNYAVSKFWIMEEWLWALGMDVPTTPEEFRAYLEGVRDQDVNKNGDSSDEIPFIFDPSLSLSSMYGPWGVVDNAANHMMVQDGKLVFVPVQDGYREGLTYFAGLYADGLIWNENFTATGAQINAIAQDSPIRMGAYTGGGLTGVVGQDKYFYYTIMRPLKDAQGARLWGNGSSPSVTNGFFAITDKCKNPEIAIKWANYFFTHQGTLEFYRGIEGETWKWNENGTYVHLSVPQNLGIDQNTWVASQRYGASGLGYFSKALRARNVADMTLLNGQTGQKQWRQTAMYQQYQPAEYVPYAMAFTADESEELSYIQSDLFNYVKEMEAKFITGQASLDSWDEYVKEVNARGLQKLMSIYQAAYDRIK